MAVAGLLLTLVGFCLAASSVALASGATVRVILLLVAIGLSLGGIARAIGPFLPAMPPENAE